ncbi:ankyrin repeat-containing domain protein [Armillaria luteobubalina]|uniref:Ankyrin repeat-containing domain protein n=1 Tax=Armillaria luteobubalina TaxID=153913 RepID=A0AA39USX1_9AGAR|nr:ankyrin repeat-containing domain protein [Armillaria luteobubalina]
MEAIGFTSALISLVDATVTVVSYLNDVKNAPAECTQLLKELTSLHIFLGTLNSLVQLATEPDASIAEWLATVRALDVPEGPFRLLSSLLEDLKRKLAPEGHRTFTTRLAERMMWKFSKEDIKDILKKVERVKSLVMIAVQQDHISLTGAIHEDISHVNTVVKQIASSSTRVECGILRIKGDISGIEGSMEKLRDHSDQKQNQELFLKVTSWISPLNFRAVQSEIYSRRVDGTGQWFLESEKFLRWVDGTESCLWCPGNPGVGKTVLSCVSSITTNHLQTMELLVLNVFCDYRSQKMQSVSQIIAALFKQLVQELGYISESTKAIYDDHQLRQYDRVYIIVDALDEVKDEDRDLLVEILRSIGSENRVSLLVTSCNIASIGSLFKDCTALSIHGTDEDIGAYIYADRLSRGHLASHISGRGELRDDIINGVTGAARGMFLLACLHMDSLAEATNRRHLRNALAELPDTVADAYNESLRRIGSQGKHRKELGYRILYWIAFAKRPLTVLELQHAFAVEPGEQELDVENITDSDVLCSVCAGLVVIELATPIESDYPDDPPSPTFCFVHYTTQEFLEARQTDIFPHIQLDIARSCLSYMLLQNVHLDIPSFVFRSFDITRLLVDPHSERRYPFLAYAFCYWGLHCIPVEESLQTNILQFLHDRKQVNALYGGSHIVPFGRGIQPLHLTASFGMLRTTEILLGSGANLDCADAEERTPLIYAARAASVDIVACLLRHGANTSVTDHWGRTSLMWAVSAGSEDVVKLLLQSPSISEDINVVSKEVTPESALSLAVRGGSLGMVNLLLGVDGMTVHPVDLRTRSILADVTSVDIAQSLLARPDVQPDCKDDRLMTPLSYAAQEGRAGVAALLMQRVDVDVNSKDFCGMTPLVHAAVSKRVDVVKLLLAHNGVDPNVRDDFGRTVLAQLIIASDHFQDPYPSSSLGGAREDISAMLLRRDDIDINAQDMYGTTPLSFAAQSGLLAIVKMILDVEDASVDVKDQDSRVPLSYVAQYGRLDIVQLLLGRIGMRSSNIKDNIGRTPLVYAASNEHLDIVEVLLRRNDVDINRQDVDGFPSLHFVARHWLVDVFDLILNICGERLDVNVKDNEGKTLLSHATQYCYIHILHRLLGQKVLQADIKDNKGWTPLFYAVTNQGIVHMNVYRKSGDKESSIFPVIHLPLNNPSRLERLTSFPEYCVDLRLEVIRLLLGRSDVSPNVVDSVGHTPIYYAIKNNDIQVVKVFLEQGIVDMQTVLSIDIPDFNGGYEDVNVKDTNGRILFSYAAERGSVAVELLLERADLDINSQDNNGRTPLSYAVENARIRTVEAILKRKDVKVNLGDMNQLTPMGYADYSGQSEEWLYADRARIAHMLRMYGCADSKEVDYSTQIYMTSPSFPELQFKPEPETVTIFSPVSPSSFSSRLH